MNKTHRIGWLLALACGLAGVLRAADQPVVTVLTDFEDESVVARITQVSKLTAADCSLKPGTIPARGQRSLEVLIGATAADASLAAGLRFRLETPFAEAERVAAYTWISEKEAEIFFRVRDAAGRIFETRGTPLKTHNRWVRVAADLKPDQLKALDDQTTALEWPIEVDGFRIVTKASGRQRLFLDDIEVEHAAPADRTVRGSFLFDKPTHLYSPGDAVKAGVELENASRQQALTLSVDLSWLRSDGSELKKERSTVNLPASGPDFRSRQRVDFGERIAEPGLYRLVARVRESRWPSSAVFETTIAVTPSNRNLPRGRETFFGVRANLLREPVEDQRLELELLEDLGVQLLALETPWSLLEPSQDRFDFTTLDDTLTRLANLDIEVVLILVEPPDWLASDAATRLERQQTLLLQLGRHLGHRMRRIAPLLATDQLDALDGLRQALAAAKIDAELWPPEMSLTSAASQSPPSGPRIRVSEGTLAAAVDAAAAAQWTGRDRWLHQAAPLDGIGPLDDGVEALRWIATAARAGLAGVIWQDLRDDSGDPRRLNQMRGLVRRDFSPKASLIGYASAVGMLNGLQPVGPVPGVPEAFESVRFMSPKKQVALLIPRPNVRLPALLGMAVGADGPLRTFDMERRELPLACPRPYPLAIVTPRPTYLVFEADRTQDAPSLEVTPPWLNLPGEVLLAADGKLDFSVRAPRALTRSSVRLVLPDGANVTCSPEALPIKLNPGEEGAFSFELKRTRPAGAPLAAKFEFTLEGERFTAPLRISAPLEATGINDPAGLGGAASVRLAELSDKPANADPASNPGLRLAASGRTLWLAIEAPKEIVPGTRVQIGLAVGPQRRPTVVELVDPWKEAKPDDVGLSVLAGDATDWGASALIEAAGKDESAHRALRPIRIPLPEGETASALRIDVSVSEPAPASFLPPRVFRLGGGPRLADSSEGYRWLTLP